MQQLSRLVMTAAALLYLPACAALAQSVPNAGVGTTTATSSTTSPEADTAEKPAAKKKKAAKMTRKQEADQAIERGTVPARYRNSVPKEYHQYIPFDKR